MSGRELVLLLEDCTSLLIFKICVAVMVVLLTAKERCVLKFANYLN